MTEIDFWSYASGLAESEQITLKSDLVKELYCRRDENLDVLV